MRKWLTISAAIIVVTIAVGFLLVLNVNSLVARNKGYLIAQAESALGRKIAVGEVEATLWSGIGARLSDFTISEDPVYGSGEFVRAKDVQINLRFWPLLHKEVQIKRVILHDPVIQIVRGADGKFNFSTMGKTAEEKEKKKEMPARENKAAGPKEASPPAWLVSLVDISDGQVHYVDRKDNADLRLQRIDLKIEDFDFNRPFSVEFSAAVFADKPNLKLESKIGPLRPAGDFSQAPLSGEITVDPFDATRFNAAAPKWKNALGKDVNLSGVFRVKDLKFSGTLKDLALTGKIDGTEGALRYGKTFHKPAGVRFALDADARYGNDKLTLRQSRLALHTLDLAAAGDIRFGDATLLNLSLDSKPAALEGWDKIVPALARYQLAGTLEVEAKVRGKAGKGAVPELQGVLSLRKASAKPPEFPKPIENLDTKINFTGQRADITDMSLTLGRSRIQLAAAIQKFTPLTLTYKMSTAELWPADYTASLSEERKADVIRNLKSAGQFTLAAGNMTYEGKLDSADGTLYNIPYKNLDATLALADKIAHIRSLRINTLSGALQVDGDYSFKEATPQFTLNSKAQGIDVKDLYTALDPKAERDIRGRMNATMKLSGSGKNWEEIKPALRGQGDAEVLQGALLNFNIAEGAFTGITGIPGLTNAISPSLRQKYPETFAAKDTEFKELKANFDIADGRINVKNLRMAAADFLVQGEGWADFTRRIDFRSTLSFSQRLSADLAQSAREMKYILNNQGQLEMPFTMKGRLPNVKPKPDTRYLGELVQRGFLRKGGEDLQNRYLGGGKDSADSSNDSSKDGDRKKKRNSTEEMIRRGLEGLFKQR